MDITPNVSANSNSIKSYGSKGFEIKEIFYASAIILDVKNLKELEVNSLEDFLTKDLSDFINLSSEILLIGTGKNHQIINQEIKDSIKKQFPNLSISEMSSSAACRTYNVLMSEGRNVAVILMPI